MHLCLEEGGGGAAPLRPGEGVAGPGACGDFFLGFQNPIIPFLNKNSVLAWKYPLLEILKRRHIEINTKLSGRNMPNIPKAGGIPDAKERCDMWDDT